MYKKSQAAIIRLVDELQIVYNHVLYTQFPMKVCKVHFTLN